MNTEEKYHNSNNSGLGVSFLIVLGLIWFFFFRGNGKWIGFYYPNASNLSSYKLSPELDSLEQCREWVDDISGGRTDTGFDYECGKNCKLTEDYKYLLKNDPKKLTQYNLQPTYVCEETLE